MWKGHLIYYDEHHQNGIGIIKYAKKALPKDYEDIKC